ncbi:hypothetical protein ACFP3T_05910 [Lactiplantibacillus dongliensis]|uniref:Extracellular protein n=1 Tax=Lactiplantibacillus dongliensis TaxID=2559919 RepID=A0ABW1R2Y8_9LACO|nr:hypothetical protein [Lactiplantibacillus dongliensis]
MQKFGWVLGLATVTAGIGLMVAPVNSQASDYTRTMPKSLRGTWYFYNNATLSGDGHHYRLVIKPRSVRKYMKKSHQWHIVTKLTGKKLRAYKSTMYLKNNRSVRAYRIVLGQFTDAPDIRASHRTIKHKSHKVLIETAQMGPNLVWTKFQPKRGYYY